MAAPAAVLSSLQAVFGLSKNLKTNKNGSTLNIDNGRKISGLTSIAKYAQRVCEDFKDLSLEDRMAAEQWIEYARTEVACDREGEKIVLKELNMYLCDKVFFVAQCLSVADVLMFFALHSVVGRLTYHEKEKFINVSRWFDNIQATPGVQAQCSVPFLRTPVYDGVASH